MPPKAKGRIPWQRVWQRAAIITTVTTAFVLALLGERHAQHAVKGHGHYDYNHHVEEHQTQRTARAAGALVPTAGSSKGSSSNIKGGGSSSSGGDSSGAQDGTTTSSTNSSSSSMQQGLQPSAVSQSINPSPNSTGNPHRTPHRTFAQQPAATICPHLLPHHNPPTHAAPRIPLSAHPASKHQPRTAARPWRKLSGS